MRCKKTQKLIMESSENKLSENTQQTIKTHLEHCIKCADFKTLYNRLHLGINQITKPQIPIELEKRTQTLCYSQILASRHVVKKPKPVWHISSMPKAIWAALILFTLLLSLWLPQQLVNLDFDQPLSNQNSIVLLLLFQNIMMLLFAPILLHKKITNRS